VGTAPSSDPTTSLPATLTGLRCDTAAIAAVPLGAVRFTGGRRATGGQSSTVVAAAIATANAATTCSPAASARRLAGSGGDGGAPHARGLATVDSAPWASVDVLVGVTSSAAGAATAAAAIAAAGAAAYPRTVGAWAPAWGLTPAAWVTDVGSPVAVVKSSITIFNNATFSPAPASAPAAATLSTSQQLGLGLGITLTLAATIALVAACAVLQRAREAGEKRRAAKVAVV